MVTAFDLIGSDAGLQDHWIKRFVAFLIDAIIIAIVAWVIFLFLPVPALWGWGLGWSFVFGVLLMLYFILMESSSGATLGKQIMKLRVISLHGELETGNVFVRNISKIFFLFLLLDWLIGFATEGDPKQKWLDRYVGMTVILTDKLTDEQQHVYQSQQSDYVPPPQEQYVAHEEPVYHYPQQQPTESTAPQEPEGTEQTCKDCGGRLVLTGSGRMQCIRCGRIF